MSVCWAVIVSSVRRELVFEYFNHRHHHRSDTVLIIHNTLAVRYSYSRDMATDNHQSTIYYLQTSLYGKEHILCIS